MLRILSILTNICYKAIFFLMKEDSLSEFNLHRRVNDSQKECLHRASRTEQKGLKNRVTQIERTSTKLINVPL